MSAGPDFAAELASAAAAWVVRLSVGSASDAEWAAFSDWLASDPRARAAYDRALDIWLLPAPVTAPPPVRTTEPRTLVSARPWALAASLVGALAIAGATGVALLRSASTSVLQTRAGERRSFGLADGSRVTLGQDSKVVVELGPRSRRVVMKRGDASFEVAGRALRPFRVIVGDDALTVLHTQFGVHRRDGRLRVVVHQGLVAVGPAQGDAGPRVRLTAGSELNHVEGTTTFQVSEVGPVGDFAWPRPRTP